MRHCHECEGIRGPIVHEHFYSCSCGRDVVAGAPYPRRLPVRAEDDEIKREWARFGWTRQGGWPSGSALGAYFGRHGRV